MQGDDFATLRMRTGMSKAAVAEDLGVDARTVAAWEAQGKGKRLSLADMRAARNLFRLPILKEKLEHILEDVFSKIPAQLCAIWLCQEQDLLLLPHASRFDNDKAEPTYNMIRLGTEMSVKSLSTFPLTHGKTLSLHGDQISNHEAKRYRNSLAFFSLELTSKSLLQAPAFKPSPHGPIPVLMLQFENRLGSDVFSDEDEARAEALAEEAREALQSTLYLAGAIEWRRRAMTSSDFRHLRRLAGNPSDEKIAQSVGCDSRTVKAWQSGRDTMNISLPHANAIRNLFREPVFRPTLHELVKKAASEIPAENTQLYIMQRDELFLIPGAARYVGPPDDLNPSAEPVFNQLRQVAPLQERSVTTYPLRHVETTNLAGDAIKEHRERYGGSSYRFHPSICHSLLHVPAFTQIGNRPRPAILLSLENKQDSSGRPLKKEGFSMSDQRLAKQLSGQYRDLVVDDMKLLGML